MKVQALLFLASTCCALTVPSSPLISARTDVALSPDLLTVDANVSVDTAFTPDHRDALTSLFDTVLSIPDDVLAAGDGAAQAWLVQHGVAGPDTLGQVAVVVEKRAPAEIAAVAPQASIWKIAKCVAAIVQLLATTAIPAAKLLKIKKLIEALGGTRKAVELILKATSKAEKLKAGGQALVALAAELLGISAVKNNCF